MIDILYMNSLLLILLVAFAALGAVTAAYDLYKYEKSDNFLLIVRKKYGHNITDVRSIKILNRDPADLPEISAAAIQSLNLRFGETVDFTDHVNTIDSHVGSELRLITTLNPTDFWIASSKLPSIRNPSMVLWDGHLLMSYQHTNEHLIYFGWLTYEKEGDPISFDYTMTHNGVNSSTDAGNRLVQHDSRLMRLSNNTVVLTYTRLVVTGVSTFHIVMIDFNQQEKKLLRSSEVLLSVPGRMQQKSWVGIEYNRRILFIEWINPLHVVEYLGPNPDKPHEGIVKEIVPQAKSSIQLPWPSKYGTTFRGGTNCLPLPSGPAMKRLEQGKLGAQQSYLAFFHTRTAFHDSQETYFMGAMTICGCHPFNVHLMSDMPIAQGRLYDGPWRTNHMDYVVYPVGMDYDPYNSSNILLSFGHQDTKAEVATMNIDMLLDSLVEVAPCNCETEDWWPK